MIAEFEILRLQAEADQQEMQKGLFLFGYYALLHIGSCLWFTENQQLV